MIAGSMIKNTRANVISARITCMVIRSQRRRGNDSLSCIDFHSPPGSGPFHTPPPKVTTYTLLISSGSQNSRVH